MNETSPEKQDVVLYTLVGCHLCDRVAGMLTALGADWRAVEIDTDPELERAYDVLIPVVHLTASGRKLFFPFDEDQLKEFLGKRR